MTTNAIETMPVLICFWSCRCYYYCFDWTNDHALDHAMETRMIYYHVHRGGRDVGLKGCAFSLPFEVDRGFDRPRQIGCDFPKWIDCVYSKLIDCDCVWIPE